MSSWPMDSALSHLVSGYGQVTNKSSPRGHRPNMITTSTAARLLPSPKYHVSFISSEARDHSPSPHQQRAEPSAPDERRSLFRDTNQAVLCTSKLNLSAMHQSVLSNPSHSFVCCRAAMEGQLRGSAREGVSSSRQQKLGLVFCASPPRSIYSQTQQQHDS